MFESSIIKDKFRKDLFNINLYITRIMKSFPYLERFAPPAINMPLGLTPVKYWMCWSQWGSTPPKTIKENSFWWSKVTKKKWKSDKAKNIQEWNKRISFWEKHWAYKVYSLPNKVMCWDQDLHCKHTLWVLESLILFKLLFKKAKSGLVMK